MNTPTIGAKAICQACNKEIEYLGSHWHHSDMPEGMQPRHIAVPQPPQAITFPVMLDYYRGGGKPTLSKEFPECPRELPFDAVNAHNRQALRNHDQTVMRLKERGGLDPKELWAVLNDRSYPWNDEISYKQAVDFLVEFSEKLKQEPAKKMKTAILFHSYGSGRHCPDGFAAAYAAWKHWGDRATYIPCVHQQEPPCLDEFHIVYFVDFSYPRDVLLKLAETKHICVLDHHKSAQENLQGLGFAMLDMNRSGAEIVWEHLHPDLPVPPLIRYVADRDLWKKELPFTEEIHRALASFPQDFVVWDTLAQLPDYVEFMRRIGEPLYQKHLEAVEKVVSTFQFRQLLNHRVAVTNTENHSVVSDVLNQLCKITNCEFALNYRCTPDITIKCELRSIGDFDVSAIAIQFGGGGHKNAAGFEVDAKDKRLKGFW